VALDRDNFEWLHRLNAMQLVQAEILISLQQETRAKTLAAGLHTDIARLLAANPDKLDWQCLLRGQLLALQAMLNDSTVIPPLRLYLQQMQDVADKGATFNTDQRRAIGKAAMLLGRLLVKTPEGSTQYWRMADQYLRPVGVTPDAQSMTLHAQVKFLLGAAEEARALAEKLAATTYRHPDYAELQQLLNPATNLAHPSKGNENP
jgi:hypothetical protein